MPDDRSTTGFAAGDMAQYKEDGHIFDVKVLENRSTEKAWDYKLERVSDGHIFTVWQVREGAWSGMWYLYPPGTYQ